MMNSSTGKTEKGPVVPRWVLLAFTKLHMVVYRLSGGRLFNSFSGDDVCYVTMTGAKSGRSITIPLMHVPYRQGVLLVATQAGAPKNPAWVHNLLKNPDITVEHRGNRANLRARPATDEEKPDLWPVCIEYYAPYAEYRERTNRNIPIFVCEPV